MTGGCEELNKLKAPQECLKYCYPAVISYPLCQNADITTNPLKASFPPRMSRPIRASLNLSAMAHNLELLKNRCPLAHCYPVVKADAYGHHLAAVLPALHSADGLAVLEMDKALDARLLGWKKPIVLLEGCFSSGDVELAMINQLDWVIHSAHQLDEFAKALNVKKTAHKPVIYLKVNTGMNRLGFPLEKAPEAIARLNQLAVHFQLPTPVLMTHFANADCEPDADNGLPAVVQHQLLMQLKPSHWRCSLGNSAGVLNWPLISGDVVRPGIAIYGSSPGPHAAGHYGLRPAMALDTQVIALQEVPTGAKVGYGSRWTAPRPSLIAIIACGYADGYPRHAPDGTPVSVGGQRAPLAGRVSMDMMTVDVTQLKDVTVGSRVELWGDEIPVDEVAQYAGTIGYELLCAVTPRVPFHIQPLAV